MKSEESVTLGYMLLCTENCLLQYFTFRQGWKLSRPHILSRCLVLLCIFLQCLLFFFQLFFFFLQLFFFFLYWVTCAFLGFPEIQWDKKESFEFQNMFLLHECLIFYWNLKLSFYRQRKETSFEKLKLNFYSIKTVRLYKLIKFFRQQ